MVKNKKMALINEIVSLIADRDELINWESGTEIDYQKDKQYREKLRQRMIETFL